MSTKIVRNTVCEYFEIIRNENKLYQWDKHLKTIEVLDLGAI